MTEVLYNISHLPRRIIICRDPFYSSKSERFKQENCGPLNLTARGVILDSWKRGKRRTRDDQPIRITKPRGVRFQHLYFLIV